jgi:V/A-type H+-transporting ATPase subunit K
MVSLLDTNGALGIAAAIAIFGGAVGTAWAQAAIGSSIMGVVAERPEEAMKLIVYMALPELILLLGFGVAFFLMGKMTGAEAAVAAQ